MSISGLDLNLVRRNGGGQRGLTVVVAADTVCGGCGDFPPVVQSWPIANIDPIEKYSSRAPGAAEKSGYSWCRFDGPVGARIDLSC